MKNYSACTKFVFTLKGKTYEGTSLNDRILFDDAREGTEKVEYIIDSSMISIIEGNTINKYRIDKESIRVENNTFFAEIKEWNGPYRGIVPLSNDPDNDKWGYFR